MDGATTSNNESDTSANISPTFSFEELKSSYTVPENEFRWGHPIQIAVVCWRELLGELLGLLPFTPSQLRGSFFLVFGGTTSVIVLSGGGFSIVGVALAFGFLVATLVYALSSISRVWNWSFLEKVW
jgi:hypothetical protein